MTNNLERHERHNCLIMAVDSLAHAPYRAGDNTPAEEVLVRAKAFAAFIAEDEGPEEGTNGAAFTDLGDDFASVAEEATEDIDISVTIEGDNDKTTITIGGKIQPTAAMAIAEFASQVVLAEELR